MRGALLGSKTAAREGKTGPKRQMTEAWIACAVQEQHALCKMQSTKLQERQCVRARPLETYYYGERDPSVNLGLWHFRTAPEPAITHFPRLRLWRLANNVSR